MSFIRNGRRSKRTGISRGNYSCRAGASYTSRGEKPERDGRGSSHDRASDTAESAGTRGSRETTTDAGATPNTSYRRRIRSGSGRGGHVDDTGRVLLPHTVLSSDLWLIRYRLSELTSGGHLDSYTQTEIRERPATSPLSRADQPFRSGAGRATCPRSHASRSLRSAISASRNATRSLR